MKAKKSDPKRASKADALTSSTANAVVPTELKGIIDKAATILDRLTEDELGQRYALGVLVRDAMDHGKYGDAALAAFTDRLHLDEDTLRAHAKVTRVWDEKEFKEQVERRGTKKANFRLSWSHFVLLSSVTDGRRRNGLVTAALKDALSENKLRALKAAKSPGQKLASMKPAAAVIRPASVLDVATELVTKGEQLKAMLESSIDEPTPELTAQLSAAEQVLAQLEALLAVTRSRISAARTVPPSAPTLKDAVAQVLMLPAGTASNQDGQGPGAQPA